MVKLLAGGNLEILKYCFGRGLEPGRRRIRALIAMIQEQSSSSSSSSSRAVTRPAQTGTAAAQTTEDTSIKAEYFSGHLRQFLSSQTASEI